MVNFVVCEFNPLHNGHKHLLTAIHEYPTVCIMSPHVTQRGEFAVTDKWTRTRMALACGADLVLELPSPFAMGAAESFAEGAMAVARATGLEGRICFGTEGDVTDKLDVLRSLPESKLTKYIKEGQKSGLSYAAARQYAFEANCPDAADILQSPNNMLALAYLRAADFSYFSLPRIGTAHDSRHTENEFCSASALRRNLDTYTEFTPPELHPIYREMLESRNTVDAAKFELVCLHKLRDLTADEWEAIAPGGIGRRFYKAIFTEQTVDELLSNVKTKCCTYASLRRLMLKAFLGAAPVETVPYIRLLGMNEVGRELLHGMKPTLPILTKPADAYKLSDEAGKMMEYEAHVTDSFAYCLQNSKFKGIEYQNSPIFNF